MARVNWQGTEIQARVIEELPNGNYKMESLSHGPRVSAGTIIEVKPPEIVTLEIGNAKFLGPGAQAQVAGRDSGQTITTVIPQSGQAGSNPMPTGGQQAAGQMPPPGPAALGSMSIFPTSNDEAKSDTRGRPILDMARFATDRLIPVGPAPQPKGTAMGTPLVEIKGLGNAITSVRSGLAGVRALAADVQVSAGALHAELTDIKGQIEDARSQIKTEASILGNSQGT